MGFVSSFLGNVTGDTGGAGANFQAGQANILAPTDVAQAKASYNQALTGIQQQQDFLSALQAQGGIANQTSAFNQTQGVANGTGPNPAQAALNQATSANVANQAALMAGQRGTGANAGLLARQAAMQGGNIQQQAAGQGATMQAQQQLAAMGQLAGIAGQQVGQQAGAVQGYNQAAQSEQQNLLNSIAAENNANVSAMSSQNASNAGVSQSVVGQQGKMMGGIASGGGSLASIFAHGGMVEKPPIKMAQGGVMPGDFSSGLSAAPAYTSASMPMSAAGQYLYSSAGAANVGNISTPSMSSAPPDTDNQDNFMKAAKEGYKQFSKPAKLPKTDPNGIGQQFAGKAPSLGVDTNLGGQPSSELKMSTPALKSTGPSLGANTALPASDFSAYTTAAADEEAPSLIEEAGEAAFDEGGEVEVPAIEDAPGMSHAAPEEKKSGLGSLLPLLALLSEGGDITAPHGKKVAAKVSPGERYLSPRDVKKVAQGKASPLKAGKKIPGKAKIKGDDYANDTVPMQLEAGGIVIPRSVINSRDPGGNAAKFVEAILAKQSMKKR